MATQPQRSDTTASSSLRTQDARTRGSETNRRDFHWFVQRTIIATCGLLIGMLLARVVGF